MLKLGLLVGMLGGAIAILLMKEPEPVVEVPEDEAAGSKLASAKRQLRARLQKARRAARDEARDKEAEMRRSFEEALQPKKQD